LFFPPIVFKKNLCLYWTAAHRSTKILIIAVSGYLHWRGPSLSHLDTLANGTITGTQVPAVVQKPFQAVQPTSTPTSIPGAIAKAASAFGIPSGSSSTPPAQTEEDILGNILTLVLDGFTSSDLVALTQGAVCRFSLNKPHVSLPTDPRRFPLPTQTPM
jgi:hypothetical protein